MDETEIPKESRFPGGSLPEVGALFTESLNEFMENIGPYIMAGLGLTVVVIPITLVAIAIGYAVLFGGMMGGVLLAEGMGDELGVVAIVLSVVGSLVGFMVVLAAMMAAMAPLNASLYRAVAEQQRGGAKLQFGSCFASLGQDLFRVMQVSAILTVLGVTGALFCYVPALLVLFLFGFATAMVALHGTAPVAAMKANLAHFRSHTQWHVVFGLLYLVTVMVASNVPILGPMFAAALHVRAYRTLFGDGQTPHLQAA